MTATSQNVKFTYQDYLHMPEDRRCELIEGEFFMAPRQIPGNLSLMLITDRNLCKQPFFDTIISALKGGVRAVQLREKGLATRELYSLAVELRKITLDFHACLIINDRVDIALAVEADGVHLGWQSLPFGVVRRLLGDERLIGVSTHSREEVLQAQGLGADYVTFGPVFDTPSKRGLLVPVGAEMIRSLKDEARLPVIAVGGINKGNVESVLREGADGIAVISGILQAADPRTEAVLLCEKIEKFQSLRKETS